MAFVFRLRNIPLEDGDEDSFSIVMAAPTAGGDQNATESILSPALQVTFLITKVNPICISLKSKSIIHVAFRRNVT